MELIPNLLQTLGLGIFFYYLIRGLRAKITALEGTVQAQNQTLAVMEKRVEATQRLSDLYRNLITNLPQDLDNYRAIISKTKDDVIIELTSQINLQQKKLEDAQKKIQESGTSKEMIAKHLKALWNLLAGKEKPELFEIIEFSNRPLEEAIPSIVESKPLEEYLQKLGFEVHHSEDRSFIRTTFGQLSKDQIPWEPTKGHISGKGWYLLKGSEMTMDSLMLSSLKDEFSSIKTI